MLRKTFSCSELCSRWNINKNDLTGIVRDKNLRALNDTYSLKSKNADGGYIYTTKDGTTGISSPGPLPIRDEFGFYFMASDVEEFEKKNKIKPHLQEKTLVKKRILKDREMFVYKEAKQLRHECPDMNQVIAKERIDILMQRNNLPPYSRTQFNRIIKDFEFPPAPRGRKPAK
jgi:hypothetical protein